MYFSKGKCKKFVTLLQDYLYCIYIYKFVFKIFRIIKFNDPYLNKVARCSDYVFGLAKVVIYVIELYFAACFLP